MRSFRSALALRAALQALALAIILLLAGTFLLRQYLVSMVDSALLEIAEIEGRIGVTPGSPAFVFRPGDFPVRTSDASHTLNPWAQLIDASGRQLERSANLRDSIPIPGGALQDAVAGRVATVRHLWNGVPVRSLIYPLTRAGPEHQDHLLHLATSLVPVERSMTRFIRVFVMLGLACAGLAYFLGWSVAGRALRPAMRLTEEAESIGVNELQRRVSVTEEVAEFHRMAEAFNGLLARLERAVTGTRRFTSDASHELRAPLTVLRGELELALNRPRQVEEYQDVLRRCLDEVLRLARLADDLLTLTRIEGGVVGSKRVTVDLEEVVNRAVARQNPLAGNRSVSLVVSGAGGPVDADGELLLRAVGGLLEHAIMASPPGGTVRVRLTDASMPSVEVTDSGQGLREEEISGVFQRFYRSERPRVRSSESGLGLPIARAVALSHGGKLDYVGNDPGASFRLSLPAAGPSGESEQAMK
jgi:two-component system OmpR family sensor kinase